MKKIRNKGLEAIHARAEDLIKNNISADLFLSFETLEHLSDPIRFLYNLSKYSDCKKLVITVPYRSESRVALQYIREGNLQKVGAETTHIFEFNPDDWKLLFKHAGWKIDYEQIYYQYPFKHWLRITKSIWKKNDFEGFYGAVLSPDNRWCDTYTDW
ncbi:MAG: hypothetical protein HQK65_00080 [Desulfamplus sp.]|nr:hypothetical protein [Desulfamplus sp.]